ncbi:MAG: hypothetical protein WDN31_14825 [Hyphomicrobium sp.]
MPASGPGCSNPRSADAPAEGRWSTVDKFHLDFCMSLPSNSPTLNEENAARAKELEACTKAKFCADYVKLALEKAIQFKNLGCGEPPVSMSTDPEVQTQACLQLPAGTLSALKNAREVKIQTCLAEKAAAKGDGTDDGTDGGPGGGVAGEPAPEQCAVVPIEPKTPPGDDGGPVTDNPGGGENGGPVPQGKGLTISKAAAGVADCSGATGCAFEITVANTTAAEVQGQVTVVDTPSGEGGLDIPSDTLSVSPPAPWVCDKGLPKTCRHPGPVPANGKLTLPIGFKPEPMRPPRPSRTAPWCRPSAGRYYRHRPAARKTASSSSRGRSRHPARPDRPASGSSRSPTTTRSRAPARSSGTLPSLSFRTRPRRQPRA